MAPPDRCSDRPADQFADQLAGRVAGTSVSAAPWAVGRRLGHAVMRDLLAGRPTGVIGREVLTIWIAEVLVPTLHLHTATFDDRAWMADVGAGLAEGALDVGRATGRRTLATVLLLEICGACHHILGYEPDLVLCGTGRAASVELAPRPAELATVVGASA